jgi:quinoprotein glucose dehydrogenase
VALTVTLALTVAAALASRERKAMAFVVPARAEVGEWPTADGVGGTHQSALADITPRTVGALQIAWTYRTGDVSTAATRRPRLPSGHAHRGDGVLYLSTPASRAVALDAETGRELT